MGRPRSGFATPKTISGTTTPCEPVPLPAYIKEPNKRTASFYKRHSSLFKKAMELAFMTGVEIKVVVNNFDQDMCYTYDSAGSPNDEKTLRTYQNFISQDKLLSVNNEYYPEYVRRAKSGRNTKAKEMEEDDDEEEEEMPSAVNPAMPTTTPPSTPAHFLASTGLNLNLILNSAGPGSASHGNNSMSHSMSMSGVDTPNNKENLYCLDHESLIRELHQLYCNANLPNPPSSILPKSVQWANARDSSSSVVPSPWGPSPMVQSATRTPKTPRGCHLPGVSTPNAGRLGRSVSFRDNPSRNGTMTPKSCPGSAGGSGRNSRSNSKRMKCGTKGITSNHRSMLAPPWTKKIITTPGQMMFSSPASSMMSTGSMMSTVVSTNGSPCSTFTQDSASSTPMTNFSCLGMSVPDISDQPVDLPPLTEEPKARKDICPSVPFATGTAPTPGQPTAIGPGGFPHVTRVPFNPDLQSQSSAYTNFNSSGQLPPQATGWQRSSVLSPRKMSDLGGYITESEPLPTTTTTQNFAPKIEEVEIGEDTNMFEDVDNFNWLDTDDLLMAQPDDYTL